MTRHRAYVYGGYCGPDEPEEPDEEEINEVCDHCDGSGKGMADGLRCSVCHGSGVTPLSRDEDDCREPDFDYLCESPFSRD